MGYLRVLVIMFPLSISVIMLISIIFFIGLGSCPEGYFSCGNSNTCIIQKNICNGYSDCPNADDEEPMYCADLYGGFWGIIDTLQYRTPNDTCDLEEIPEGCNCSDYTAVICVGLSLKRIPSYLPKGTKHLILAKNDIILRETDFSNYSLQIINLSENSIDKLPKNIFHGQKDLKKLFLFKNELSEIPEDMFSGLKNLSWLFLNDNMIKKLNFDNWNLESLTWLELAHNKISLKTRVFPVLPSLSLLYLDWNLIEEITENTFINLSALIDLSIAWNKIKSIHPLAFSTLRQLQDLNLRNNELIHLSEITFTNSRNLQKLNLGGNGLLIVTDSLLSSLQSLRSLNLEGIDLDNSNVKIFSQLHNLEFIYFKRFKYCIYVPHVPKCSPFTDGTSSTVDLLMNGMVRLTLWLVAFLILLTNGVVLWHRMVSPAFDSPLNLLISNLAGSDLLMGCYLLIIGTQDIKYKGIYITHAREWMSSWLCTTAGVLAMTSSEVPKLGILDPPGVKKVCTQELRNKSQFPMVTVMLLFIISAERYLLIAAPLQRQKTLKPHAAFLSVSAVWMIGILTSLMPVLTWRDSSRFYGTNKFCFPLHIDEPFLMGWHYSAFVFIGLNSIGMIGIGFLYYGVLLNIYKTRRETTLNVRDIDLAKRLFLIVVTNACCWVPVIIMKILAILGTELSGELYGWLVVFILPINSSVNPILYTFTIPHYRVVGREKPITLKRKLSRVISSIRKQQGAYDPPKSTEEEM